MLYSASKKTAWVQRKGGYFICLNLSCDMDDVEVSLHRPIEFGLAMVRRRYVKIPDGTVACEVDGHSIQQLPDIYDIDQVHDFYDSAIGLGFRQIVQAFGFPDFQSGVASHMIRGYVAVGCKELCITFESGVCSGIYWVPVQSCPDTYLREFCTPEFHIRQLDAEHSQYRIVTKGERDLFKIESDRETPDVIHAIYWIGPQCLQTEEA